MMAGRPDWVGTTEEMLETLSQYGDETSTAWMSSPATMLATLQELWSKLADADLFVVPMDDERLFVYRRTGEEQEGDPISLGAANRRPH